MRVINQIVTGGGHHLVPTKWTLGLQFRLMPISVAISPAFQAIRKHEKHGFDYISCYLPWFSITLTQFSGRVSPAWLASRGCECLLHLGLSGNFCVEIFGFPM